MKKVFVLLLCLCVLGTYPSIDATCAAMPQGKVTDFFFGSGFGKLKKLPKKQKEADGFVWYKAENEKGSEIILKSRKEPLIEKGFKYVKYEDGHFLCTELSGYTSVYDRLGNCIIPEDRQYSLLRKESGDGYTIYHVKRGEHWGICNASGSEIIVPEYDLVILHGDNDDGYYYGVKNGKYYGIFMTSGKVLIFPEKYTGAGRHGDKKEGFYYIVENGDYEGVCRADGSELIAPDKYTYILRHGTPKDGFYFTVGNGEHIGVCLADGSELIKPDKYTGILRLGSMTEGFYYQVEVNGKTGVCNAAGKEIIEPAYYESIVYTSFDDTFKYKKGGEYIAMNIDINGNRTMKAPDYTAPIEDDDKDYASNDSSTGYSGRHKEFTIEYRNSGNDDEEDDYRYEEKDESKEMAERYEAHKLITEKAIRSGNPSEIMTAYDFIVEMTEKYPVKGGELLYNYSTLFMNLANSMTIAATSATTMGNFAGGFTLSAKANNAMISYHAYLQTSASLGYRPAIAMIKYLASIGQYSGPMYDYQDSDDGGQGSMVRRTTCGLCHGKGWIPGSKTPTYGNMGEYYCEECDRMVSYSHSHDRCPRCGGKGYYNDI